MRAIPEVAHQQLYAMGGVTEFTCFTGTQLYGMGGVTEFTCFTSTQRTLSCVVTGVTQITCFTGTRVLALLVPKYLLYSGTDPFPAASLRHLRTSCHTA
jgi:hypothetical protein